MFFVLLLAAVLVCVGAPALVYAAKGDLIGLRPTTPASSAPLVITLGKADLVDVTGDVSDVLVANPQVIDVMAVQSNRLYIVGLNVGDTNIMALDAMGDIVKRLDVHVTYDLQAIQSMVDMLFSDEEIKVDAVHDQILLTGTVSTPNVASKVTDLVARYVSDVRGVDGEPDKIISNLLNVRGEQQVMLQVKILEASRTILKELGIESNFNDTNELSTSRIFKTYPPESYFGNSPDETNAAILNSVIGLSQDAVGSLGILADTGVKGIGTFGLFLQALEEENLVNTLAEPNLTAVSGEQAGFLAGGEFPVPTGRDQVGNIIVEFREFGVSLNFRPVVMSDKRISLQMNTEVSSLDFESAIVLADLTVPGLDIRRAETTVEIPSGGSLMIAGLLQSEAVEGMSGLPGIRKTPVLGDLVSSDSFKRDETELVVIVTPILVEPFADKERSKKRKDKKKSFMAMFFESNVRRAYDVNKDEVFEAGEPFGYMLD